MPKLKKHPYHSSFSSFVKPIVSEDRDKYLALASMDELAKFIPDVKLDKNVDLLPVAFNAFVANRVNKNDDVIDTATAVAIAEYFINKPINAEHNRQHIIGTILSYSFTEFGTDKPLNSETLKAGYNAPFNVTLGGVLWKTVNSDITDKVEESNDPSSPDYMSISASWELGFSDYAIASIEVGKKNLEDGKTVIASTEFDTLKGMLKANGGTGEKDGFRVYRQPTKDVLPLGIGFTNNPAADVEGVAAGFPFFNKKDGDKKDEGKDGEKSQDKKDGDKKGGFPFNNKDKSKDDKSSEDKKHEDDPKDGEEDSKEGESEDDKKKKNNKNISQTSKSNVNSNEENIAAMKITQLSDIEAKWTEINASAVTEFVKKHIADADAQWKKEVEAQKTLAETATTLKDALEKEQAKLQTQISDLEKKVAASAQVEAERQQVEAFNVRMSKVAEAYELTDELSAVIASQIKVITTDEAFAAWEKQAEIIFKPYNKAAKAAEAKAASDKAAASKENKGEAKASTQAVVDDALDKAKKDAAGLPNSSTGKDQTLEEKFAKFFTLKDGFNFNTK